jgi:hypothetical protein
MNVNEVYCIRRVAKVDREMFISSGLMESHENYILVNFGTLSDAVDGAYP